MHVCLSPAKSWQIFSVLALIGANELASTEDAGLDGQDLEYYSTVGNTTE